MYGTVMVGRLRAAPEELDRVNREWLERRAPGFVRSDALITDDGKTVVSIAVFESQEAYRRLAADPAQDAFWRERIAPLLDGEPQWFDGVWRGTLHPLTEAV